MVLAHAGAEQALLADAELLEGGNRGGNGGVFETHHVENLRQLLHLGILDQFEMQLGVLGPPFLFFESLLINDHGHPLAPKLHAILVGIGIHDPAFGPQIRRLAARRQHQLPLLGDLLLHLLEPAAHDFLQVRTTALHIDDADGVGNIRSPLMVGVKNADVDHPGVAHFLELHGAPEPAIDLLHRQTLADGGEFLDQFQPFDDRVENLRGLQNLELRGHKLRIVAAHHAAAEHADRVGAVRFHLHAHPREILARHEIRRHARRDHDEKKGEQDQTHAHLDGAPVVEEVKFDLVGFVHRKGIGSDGTGAMRMTVASENSFAGRGRGNLDSRRANPFKNHIAHRRTRGCGNIPGTRRCRIRASSCSSRSGSSCGSG